MSANKKTADRKSGGILVVVMLMTLIISIMAIAMYKLQESGGVGVVRAKQSQQAFWLAEAGLRDAIQRLNWNLKENPSDVAGYRDSPYVITSNNVGKGSYEVDIPGVTTPVGFNLTNYTITAVGRVLGINRRVQQIFTVRPGSKFAIILKGGDSEFNSNTEVSEGGVAVFNGSLDTGNNDTVDLGDVYTDSDVTLTGDGDYTQVPMPSELEEPTFDPISYQTRIGSVPSDTATVDLDVSAGSIPETSSYTITNVTFTSGLTVPSGAVITSYGDIVFRRTTTFNGPVTIEAGGDVTFIQSSDLPAGSTIIAGGDVDLAGSIAASSTIIAGGTVDLAGSISVGSNVEILAGDDLAFGNQVAFAGHSTFYAENELSVASGGSSTVSGDGIAFLSNGSISLNSNFNPFRGLMFTNGDLNFNANMDIYGTVVGELGVDAASNVDFFYDVSAYAWALESGGIGIDGLDTRDAVLTRRRWQELPPL